MIVTPITPEIAWTWPLAPLIAILLTAAIYLRGFLLAHRTRPHELPTWRAISFLSGLLILWIALASPIDSLDDVLLTAHMLQHFLLMSIVPPLLILGAPIVPLLRGLPRPLIRHILGPLLRLRPVQAFLYLLAHPLTAWLLMNIAYLAWHIPASFELTLHNEHIHDTEHLCFLLTSLLFWQIVLSPWPARPRWHPWIVIPFLFTADVVNTGLSAFLVFCGRVLYPSYAAAPRVCSLTPLQDQAAAGAGMWVLNSLVFLIPAMILTMRLLESPRHRLLRIAARAGK